MDTPQIYLWVGGCEADGVWGKGALLAMPATGAWVEDTYSSVVHHILECQME